MPRVTLTKSQQQSEIGIALLGALEHITEDGEISLSEINQLKGWLEQTKAFDLPALTYLAGEIDGILADGKITSAERIDLYVAIERVLPQDKREEAKRRRLHAQGITEDPVEKAFWRSERITDAQHRYLRDLGGDPSDDMSKAEASDAIDEILKRKQSVSNRQMMVLRFWNKVEVADGGRAAVSEWLDALYQNNPECADAWEMWKERNLDRGAQDDPNKVRLGEGYEYLASAPSRYSSFWIILGIIFVIGILYFVISSMLK